VAGDYTGYRFFNTGDWQRIGKLSLDGLRFPVSAFSSDGKLLAVAASNYLVKLLNPATAQEIARLQAPHPQMITWLAFSPSGDQLAVACSTRIIQLWDLRSIRGQLAKINLDWDLPLYPPRTTTNTLSPPNVEVTLKTN
jgi:WD40 repeat protein